MACGRLPVLAKRGLLTPPIDTIFRCCGGFAQVDR
jgi:hypothetical protein